MTNFEKWKQSLKPEDLVQDYGPDAIANDEHRYGVRLDCINCPIGMKNCKSEYWTSCGDVFLEWANQELEK